MIAAYFVACLMSLAVSSATGLGVIDGNPVSGDGKRWYQSLRSCCHLCLPFMAIILAPTSGDVVPAAQASEMSLIDFAFKTTLSTSIAVIIGMAIAHVTGNVIG